MIQSVRHLRGTESEWSSFDCVIPDGEIAILKTHAGNCKIKVGNGIDNFSSLPSVTGDSVITDERNITLQHGKSYRLGECSLLTLEFPDRIDDDYYCEFSFDSGVDASEIVFSNVVRLTGDGVADEELMPEAETHYTVFIWYDGELQGVVRGLPNA